MRTLLCIALGGSLAACAGTESGNPTFMDEPTRGGCLPCDEVSDCDAWLVDLDMQNDDATTVRGSSCQSGICLAVTQNEQGCFVLGAQSGDTADSYECTMEDDAIMQTFVDDGGLQECDASGVTDTMSTDSSLTDADNSGVDPDDDDND